MNSFQAFQLLQSLPAMLQAYLAQRADNYGIPVEDLLRKMPAAVLDNPLEIFDFLKNKHISHLQPLADGGDPAAFGNWIFEDGATNISRGAHTINLHDYLSAQADNLRDGISIDFATPDPGTAGYDPQFDQVFGHGLHSHAVPLHDVGDAIDSLANGSPEVLDQAHQALHHSLLDLGIPVGYVVLRGLRSVWPFLRSIDWRRLSSDSRYRTATLLRALRTFREGGWKELTKAVVMGFLLAHCPPLSTLAGCLGLVGVAALGVRWLAERHQRLPKPVAAALGRVADALDAVAGFLRGALAMVERVVDVVIETGQKLVRRVVKASEGFVQQVATVAQAVVRQVGQHLVRGAQLLTGWVCSWFGTGPQAQPCPGGS